MPGHAGGLVQIASFLRRNALRFPNRTAFSYEGRRMTWRHADQVSDRLAYRFRALGVGRADHVAILGDNCPTYILATYALFKLGATAVILNTSLQPDSLALQLNHAQAKAVVTGAGFQSNVNGIRDDICSSIFLTWDATDRCAGVINLDAELRSEEVPEPFPIAAVDPNDIACLILSSGTTGTPKGAINTYWNLFVKNISLALAQEFREGDIGLLVTPLCMGGTQLMSINPYIMLGMTAVVMPSFDPARMLQIIEAERVTTVFCVPTMTNAVLSHADFATRDLSSWKRLISAGAPLPQESYRLLVGRGIDVLECYGTSETGGGIMASAADKAAKPRSVGRAMVGFEVQVLDDVGQPLDTGHAGEIAIRGDAVAVGYYNQPEIEAATFVDGWFRTGDIGLIDADGYLSVVDRKKDMIKSGGINVFPKDIEDVLQRIPDLAECAVVGLPHDHWGEAVTAFVARRERSSIDAETVMNELKSALAKYQVPKAIVFLDALPKTMFGKLSKIKLREDYVDLYREISQRGEHVSIHVPHR